ncbi:autotransporter domain-containing protein [Agrobacterium tumefaciens]|uniref:autotransporter outer membrane beta-barrel domain-containing protein n=1 Tax=Agrobacterium tumefaciens TaxID=358 RepID=UPI00287C38E8|nr:autotransporter domain-containing protein [Agrobacterium tumefaciens]MDS7594595.1 autotransporter domain-containing protein [Agrobacterium tumefaciens]
MTQQLLPVLSRRLGLFTALASLAFALPSFAQSVWTGADDNEFSNTANWNPDLPGAADAAAVNGGSPQVTNDVTIDRLGVDGGNVTITNTGMLTVTNGSTITSGSVGINAGGVLNSDVNLDGGSLFIDGSLNGDLKLNTGNVTVNGTLGSATVGAATSLSNNGTVGDLSVSSGGTFTNNSGATAGALTNAGTASNAGTLGSLTNTAGNFTNNTGGTITGNTTISNGTVTNNFVVTDVDVAAAAAFVNNTGAAASNVRNAGTVTNAGTIASLQNDAGNFTNAFGGTVTGNTTISGGTVTNNFVVTDVDVAAAAAFVNNSGATAGNVRNSGTVTNAGTIASLQNDAGTFINNFGGTVAGTTTISGGTVTNNFVVTDVDVAAVATFINNSGANAGNIQNAGTVNNAGALASLQNDAGTFTNNSGGTVSGTTKVDGGTVINNDTLANVEIGTGGTFTNNGGATAGAVTNSGNAFNDGTIASLVNNNGSFSNTGTISGGATVAGGELINEGTVTGAIDVFDGGLLSGSGIAGGLSVNAGGTLAPGPEIQTLAVNGDLTFHAGSIYQVDVASSGLSDRVDTSGNLVIDGGTVNIRATGGTYGLTNSYTILTASNITGTFDNIVSDFAFLSPELNYSITTVDLDLDRNTVDFADVALTGNDRATAAAIEKLGPTNALFSVVLPLDVQTAASAFSQLDGEAHASLKTALLWQGQHVREAIIDQTRPSSEQQSASTDGVSYWATGILAQNHIAGDGNARGADNSAAGALMGADAALSDTWRLGGVLGYSNLSSPHQADADSYHAGFYAAGDFGHLDFVGGAIYSRNEISTRRNIAFGSFEDLLSADYAGTTAQVFADMSWTLETGDLSLQPFANLAYTNLDTDDFTERGGAAALSVIGGSSNIAASTAGMRWSARMTTDERPIVVSGMLGWRHSTGDLAPVSLAAFQGGSPFILEGVTMPRDALVVKAGISAKLSKAARLTLSYSGEFGQNFQSNVTHAHLSVNF